MKSFLFSATKGNKESTLLNKSAPNVFFFKEQNTESLAVAYNQAIDFAIKEEVDYLVLCHDDVIINPQDITDFNLSQLHKDFDVVGVAGSSAITIQEPILWHIMGGGGVSGKLHGAVAHPVGNQKHITGFGPYPNPAVIIDGVFMSISKNAFTQVRFDESNPAKFHFYDLSYSLDCSLNRIKVGVGDIIIMHNSPGLSEFTEEFREGQKWFIDKYSKYKGKKITV